MRKKANLLIGEENYKKYEKIFFQLRVFSLLAVVITFLTSFVILLILVKKQENYQKLLQEKEKLIFLLSTKNKKMALITTASERFDFALDALENDANFLPYYDLIINSLFLQQATSSAKLTYFQIDKNRKFEFSVTFSDVDEMLNYFKHFESKDFLSNFEEISLNNFSLVSDKTTTSGFNLKFLGKFKKINYEN